MIFYTTFRNWLWPSIADKVIKSTNTRIIDSNKLFKITVNRILLFKFNKHNMAPKKVTSKNRKEEKEADTSEKTERKTRSKRKATSEETDSTASDKKSATPAKKSKPSKPTPINSTATKWAEANLICNKKNKDDKSYNFHIISWNVSGLRSWVGKGGLEILQHSKPDIFCIQETKCNDDQIPSEITELSNYKQYWCSSEGKGYAGVGILSTIEPIKVLYGIKSKEHDKDGRCITAEYENFFLVNVYVPNAGNQLVTLPKRLAWNKVFKSYIKSLDTKKPVIVCGDLNVAHEEIDLANPKTNTKNAGFTPEEREGFTDFLQDGYIDTFRQLYPEQKGAYTFWSYRSNARSKNVGWRLDYFVVSERLFNSICDNVIHNQVLGSDHCPFSLYFTI